MHIFLSILNMRYVMSEGWLSITYVIYELTAWLIMPPRNQYCAVHSKRKCGHFSVLLRSHRFWHITRHSGENDFMYYKVCPKYCTGLWCVQWHKEQIHLDNVSVHISDDFHDFLISRMFNIDYYHTANIYLTLEKACKREKKIKPGLLKLLKRCLWGIEWLMTFTVCVPCSPL